MLISNINKTLGQANC